MFTGLRMFTTDEAGAVTIDWVVMTAAVVGLATAIVIELRAGSAGLTAETKSYLESTTIGGTTPDTDD